MTTKPPPTYYFDYIKFNSGYYTIVNEGDSLTQSKADLRYLIKTQNDTSNNLQTFSGGISTPTLVSTTTECTNIKALNYQSTSVNNALLIGNNQLGASAKIDIGCNATRLGSINIGNIQTTGTGNIIIGSDVLTAPGSQNITINRPLKIGYSAVTELDSTVSKIGSYLTNTSTEALIVNSNTSGTTLTYFYNIPPGLYMFEYQINYRITVNSVALAPQKFILSNTLNDFQTSNIIEDQFTSLFKSNLENISISSPINEYTHKFSKAGVFVLPALSDVYLNYRISYAVTTTVPYIIGSLKLVRIG